MTAKSKTRVKQSAMVGGALVTLAAGTYTVDFRGCDKNSVAKETFESYVVSHREFADMALKGIDEKFTAIKETLAASAANDREWRTKMDGKLDQLIGLMITRRADAGGTWNEECAFP